MGANPDLDEHFALSIEIDRLTKKGWRVSPATRKRVADLAMRQIAMSDRAAEAFRHDPVFGKDGHLPVHLGFYHLFLLLEEGGEYARAITLAEDAKRAGWEARYPGRWDQRIARVVRKVEKSGTNT
jgi:hypothetical protein